MFELDIYAIVFPEAFGFKRCEEWLHKHRPNDDNVYMTNVHFDHIQYLNIIYVKKKGKNTDCIVAELYDGVDIVYIKLYKS
jgi:hypothetical protein